MSAAAWAEAHKHPKGPGDARPTAMAIIESEQLVGQWKDKVVLVTGASNGIGVETARALHMTGAHLLLPVRDLKKGEGVAKDIEAKSEGKGGRIDVLHMDMNSLASVRRCAQEVLTRTKQLNVLICNAGVMATPEGKTEDGFETQFGTNHVAHFLLFELLKPTLLASSTPQFNSRVVMVSSSGHKTCSIFPGDYEFKQAGYSPWKGYGQAKTANILMANEIDRRYGSQGLHALSLMPGGIKTGLQVHVQEMMKKYESDAAVMATIKSTEQGAATTVWAATAKEWEGKGGVYLENCKAAVKGADAQTSSGEAGYAAWAYDEEAAKRLYDDSLTMVAAHL